MSSSLALALEGLVLTPNLGALLDDELALCLHSQLGTEDDSGRQSEVYTFNILYSHVTVGRQSVTIFGAQNRRSAGEIVGVVVARSVADAEHVGAIVAAALHPNASLDGGDEAAAKAVGIQPERWLGRMLALREHSVLQSTFCYGSFPKSRRRRGC